MAEYKVRLYDPRSQKRVVDGVVTAELHHPVFLMFENVLYEFSADFEDGHAVYSRDCDLPAIQVTSRG